MGINVDITISVTFLLGGLMAGAAGIIYALYQTPRSGSSRASRAGLIAFTAAVMGGIGNLYGAVLGGLIIGCIQQMSDDRIASTWTPRNRLRLPHPDHGVQAAGPARRGDAGGWMTTIRQTMRSIGDAWRGLPRQAHIGVAVAAFVLLVILPFGFTPGGSFIDKRHARALRVSR